METVLLQREHLSAALNATGVAWRWGLSPCHWNVLPPSNLKPWTPGQQAALEGAVSRLHADLRVTRELVKTVGRYFDVTVAGDGKGFRVFSVGNPTVPA